MLEQKLGQENMKKTKDEISEHCIKELKDTNSDNGTDDITGDGLVFMDIEE